MLTALAALHPAKILATVPALKNPSLEANYRVSKIRHKDDASRLVATRDIPPEVTT
ncbi:hypothetical protein HO173_013110 [Letharia columbiana]|uniref:Uncharacterized protein n=1 Tax=Letharia columbiana TaxID=112416 RepID=A0A8H6FD18_9LECA|nr:uncharacterized protein HO173_013110 [Letharia columbiana]KAF6223865.1 hypothetical protein HO173_013110 [Letharia columbiana]